jgi:hypothetical protein
VAWLGQVSFTIPSCHFCDRYQLSHCTNPTHDCNSFVFLTDDEGDSHESSDKVDGDSDREGDQTRKCLLYAVRAWKCTDVFQARMTKYFCGKGKGRADPGPSQSTGTGTTGEEHAQILEEAVRAVLCAALRQNITPFSFHIGGWQHHTSRTG